MQVSNISFIPQVIPRIQNVSKKVDEKPQQEKFTSNLISNYSYKDYNINFGERLFRTPANFFAQTFNKKNMPDTMKEYLNADYEDRQNIPPAQMMKIVFDDLNQIKNMDYVPRVFPNEPLFNDLTDVPNKKARIGLLSEVETLKSEMEEIPLFKDGTSNLGMYLLKKIYLEGKILSEINKDFKKDLSEDYKDLITSDVDYTTINAYGIKFPNKAFWKSFVATREDFPYEYKPRKNKDGSPATRSHEQTPSTNEQNTDKIDTRPPKFKTVGDEFVRKGRKIGEAIFDAHGDSKKVEKAMRRKGLNNSEEISFVSKYLGPIMSIALEKIHASEEMRNYFEQYDSMSKKQKQKMDGYWQSNPAMKEFQSRAIQDTIKLFFEAYGADGNNDDFKDLLDYAAQIKPNREKRDELHRLKQIELEETFANYQVAEEGNIKDEMSEVTLKPEITEPTEEELRKQVLQEAIKNGAKVYSYRDENGKTYNYIVDLDKYFSDKMMAEFHLLPSSVIRKFINFAQKSPLYTPEYKKAIALLSQKENLPDFIKAQLLSMDDCLKISNAISDSFEKRYPEYTLAATQALAERIIARTGTKYTFILKHNAMSMVDMCESGGLNINDWSEEERKILNNSYQNYLRPLTDQKEIIKINKAMINYFSDQSLTKEWEVKEFGELEDLYGLLAATTRKHPELKNTLSKIINKSRLIESCGGSARMLINPDTSDKIKIIKAKIMIGELIKKCTKDMIRLLSTDEQLIFMYIKDSELRKNLLDEHKNNK